MKQVDEYKQIFSTAAKEPYVNQLCWFVSPQYYSESYTLSISDNNFSEVLGVAQ